MQSPFPGMNPYLETREHWQGFHTYLAVEISSQLNRVLPPRYYADIEVETSVEEVGVEMSRLRPDAAVLDIETPPSTQTASPAGVLSAPIERVALSAEEIKQRAVHIYLKDERELVTAVEILSPANKRGRGLAAYTDKRERILRSSVHLVEIDLLRGGTRPGWELQTPPLETDYVLLLNRARPDHQRISAIWPVALNEPLPLLPIPLIPPNPDVVLDLNTAVHTIYEREVYARRLNYDQPVPPPPLRPEMAHWLAGER